jgi:hypothetical protein
MIRKTKHGFLNNGRDRVFLAHSNGLLLRYHNQLLSYSGQKWIGLSSGHKKFSFPTEGGAMLIVIPDYSK